MKTLCGHFSKGYYGYERMMSRVHLLISGLMSADSLKKLKNWTSYGTFNSQSMGINTEHKTFLHVHKSDHLKNLNNVFLFFYLNTIDLCTAQFTSKARFIFIFFNLIIFSHKYNNLS